MAPKIITSYVCPPVPFRNADWAAWYEGTEESGEVGRGATEIEAIADLIDTYGEEE